MNKVPNIFARILKIDEEKRLVFGRAVHEVADKSDEIFDYAGSKPHFEAWSSSVKKDSGDKSLGNVRAMHGTVAAGKIEQMLFDDKELAIDVSAKIVDDAEWKKCLEGVYTGFSIGGRYMKKWKDPTNPELTRYIAKPSEISLVDRPCIPTATFFDIQKADGSVVKKAFVAELEADLEKKFKFPADAKQGDKAKDGDGDEHTFDKEAGACKCDKCLGKADAGSLQKGDDPVVAAEEEPKEVNVQGTEDEILAFGKLLNDSHISIGAATAAVARFIKRLPTDEQIATKSRELAEAAGVKIDKAEQLMPFLAVAKEMLVKVAERDDTTPKEGESKYGAVKFADEKNKKYPLDTEKHVKSALSYWGMTKNKAKYSAEDQATIGGKIQAAAKELGIGTEKMEKGVDEIGLRVTARVTKMAAASGITDLAKADKDTMAKFAKKAEWQELRKGLSSCASFMYALDSLCNLQESVELEAASEGDNSPIPAELSQAIHDLGAVAVSMLQEELQEEYEGTEAKSSSNYADTAHMSEAAQGLVKRALAGGLAKTGARHSASDLLNLQKAHDILSGHFGVKCDMPNKADGTVDTVALGEYLTKIASTNTEDDMVHLHEVHKCLASLGVKCDKGDAIDVHGDVSQVKLAKLISDSVSAAVAKVVEVNKVEMDAIKADLKKALDRPAPARVVLKAIGKGDDTGSGGGGIAKVVDPILNPDGTVNESATAIKKAQAAGPVKGEISGGRRG